MRWRIKASVGEFWGPGFITSSRAANHQVPVHGMICWWLIADLDIVCVSGISMNDHKKTTTS